MVAFASGIAQNISAIWSTIAGDPILGPIAAVLLFAVCVPLVLRVIVRGRDAS